MEKAEQADASELVLEITSPMPSEAFSLFKVREDGTKVEYKLRVRLLREMESIAALKEAQAYAKAQGEVDEKYGDIYKEAQACSVIARCLCRPKKETLPNGTEYYPQLFVSAEQLRQSFTENEIAVCLNVFEVVKAKYRCTEEWKPEEVDKWAARLSDTLLGPLWLGRLDSLLWPELIFALAKRASELSATPGLPPLTSPDTTEPSLDGSGEDTGGSISSPHVQYPDGEKLPDNRLLSKAEADEIARRRRNHDK